MGWMMTVVKDGETLTIEGGKVLIRPKPGKYAMLAILAGPDTRVQKTGSPNNSEEKEARGRH
jgi:hypothetical protein